MVNESQKGKSEKMKKLDFKSDNLIQLIWGHKYPIAIVAVMAIVLSVVFSGPRFITPLFKSEVILFPISTNAISGALLTDNYISKMGFLEFGEEEDAEQLLQILNSNEIRDKIIKRYDLMNHYEIDTTSIYKRTDLHQEYQDNIQYSRTEFMAVKIEVMDKDPVYAANIANDIASFLDSVKSHMQHERAFKAFKLVENEYFDSKKYVAIMEDSLKQLRKLGVVDYETQAEMFNEQLAIAVAKNDQRAIRAIEDRMSVLREYGGAYVSIRDALEYEKKQLSELKFKYQQAKVDANAILPAKYVVDSADIPEKKSYPTRWLIVLIALTSSVILYITFILSYGYFINNIRKK